ncbi:hypothetical protein EMGBS15_05790 [Filimonas sp.]|nr:hypothetical protein EMGBS15_05790 [Filimonas sp.]
MAAQRYKNILFSYSGLISSTEEIKMIMNIALKLNFQSVKPITLRSSISDVIRLPEAPIRLRRCFADISQSPLSLSSL